MLNPMVYVFMEFWQQTAGFQWNMETMCPGKTAIRLKIYR
jgi:hypothetical protein